MSFGENSPTAQGHVLIRQTSLNWEQMRVVSTGDTPRRVSSIRRHRDSLKKP